MEKIKQFKKNESKKATGVDLGINKMIVLSDGRSFDSPKPLKNNLRKLKRQQRQIAKKIIAAKRDKRKLRDTKNFQKQKNKIAKTHFKITNIRKDTIHKVTSFITTNFSKIVIEPR